MEKVVHTDIKGRAVLGVKHKNKNFALIELPRGVIQMVPIPETLRGILKGKIDSKAMEKEIRTLREQWRM